MNERELIDGVAFQLQTLTDWLKDFNPIDANILTIARLNFELVLDAPCRFWRQSNEGRRFLRCPFSFRIVVFMKCAHLLGVIAIICNWFSNIKKKNNNTNKQQTTTTNNNNNNGNNSKFSQVNEDGCLTMLALKTFKIRAADRLILLIAISRANNVFNRG